MLVKFYFTAIYNPQKKQKNYHSLIVKKISHFSKVILKKAINKGGSSIRDFKNTKGKIGSFQKDFKVYQRKNLNCLKLKCSGIIIKKIISNRSSFFCNKCQK